MLFKSKTLLSIALTSVIALSAQAETFTLTSQSVKADSYLTQKFFWNQFGCTGENVSPQLSWKNVPAGTKSFALTMYDKDAPTGSGFWHYQIYNIPANVTSVNEGDLSSQKLPAGAVESRTDLGQAGYFGPCPPVGRDHEYTYTVYALPVAVLNAPDGKPADGSQTSALTGFSIWANKPLAKATFKVRAKR
jgi:Raf kinase inhibitor-like YbhB/YbcL family protein